MFEFIIQDDGDVYFVLLDMRYIFTFKQQKKDPGPYGSTFCSTTTYEEGLIG